MNWDISSEQNAQRAVDLLSARFALFRLCNGLVVVGFIVPVLLVIGSFVAYGLYPEIAPYLTIFSLLWLLFNVLLVDRFVADCAFKAATLVEEFDCSVFDMERNSNFSISMSTETVANLAAQVGAARRTKLKDWYSKKLGDLPRHVAGFVGQYTSTSYDQGLRKSYLKILWFLAIALIAGLAVFLIIRNERVQESLILFVVPLMPLAEWLIRSINGNSNLVAAQENALCKMDEQWKLIVNGRMGAHGIAAMLRDNQDALFLRRLDTTIVFPYLYLLCRPKLEGRATKRAEDFIQEYSNR